MGFIVDAWLHMPVKYLKKTASGQQILRKEIRNFSIKTSQFKKQKIREKKSSNDEISAKTKSVTQLIMGRLKNFEDPMHGNWDTCKKFKTKIFWHTLYVHHENKTIFFHGVERDWKYDQKLLTIIRAPSLLCAIYKETFFFWHYQTKIIVFQSFCPVNSYSITLTINIDQDFIGTKVQHVIV